MRRAREEPSFVDIDAYGFRPGLRFSDIKTALSEATRGKEEAIERPEAAFTEIRDDFDYSSCLQRGTVS